MKVIFIVPCFNAEENLDLLCKSLTDQRDQDWGCILIDDMSEDKTSSKIESICKLDRRFHGQINTSKKFALKNIVETSRLFQ